MGESTTEKPRSVISSKKSIVYFADNIAVSPPKSVNATHYDNQSLKGWSQASSVMGTAGLSPYGFLDEKVCSGSQGKLFIEGGGDARIQSNMKMKKSSTRSQNFRKRFSLKVSSSRATKVPMKDSAKYAVAKTSEEKNDVSDTIVDIQGNGDVEILFGQTLKENIPHVDSEMLHLKQQPRRHLDISSKNSTTIYASSADPSDIQDDANNATRMVNHEPDLDETPTLYEEPAFVSEIPAIVEDDSDSHSRNDDSVTLDLSLGLRWPFGECACTVDTTHTSDNVQKQQVVENTIENFLGTPAAWCEGRKMWCVHIGSSESSVTEPSDVRRVLRNRAGFLNSQARRIQKLRNDLFPFDKITPGSAAFANGHHGKYQPKLMPVIGFKKFHSFPERQQVYHPSAPDVSSSVVPLASAGIESFKFCGESSELENNLEYHQDDECCYDSDPGEFALSHGKHRRVHPRSRSRRKNQGSVEEFLRYGSWNDNALSQKAHSVGFRDASTLSYLEDDNSSSLRFKRKSKYIVDSYVSRIVMVSTTQSFLVFEQPEKMLFRLWNLKLVLPYHALHCYTLNTVPEYHQSKDDACMAPNK